MTNKKTIIRFGASLAAGMLTTLILTWGPALLCTHKSAMDVAIGSRWSFIMYPPTRGGSPRATPNPAHPFGSNITVSPQLGRRGSAGMRQELQDATDFRRWPNLGSYWAYESHTRRLLFSSDWQWGVVGRETLEYQWDIAEEPRRVEKPPAWSCFSTIDPEMPQPASALEVMFGWPMRCMYYRKWASEHSQWFDDRYTRVGNTTTSGVWLEKGIAIGDGDKAIPLGMIWSGLAINTLIYACFLFASSTLFGVCRSRIRLARGRCPMCSYRLEGDVADGCPECGWGRRSES